MRMSLSFTLAAVVSFALLLVMARLVHPQMGPVSMPSLPRWDESAPSKPTSQTIHRTTRVAPEKPTAKSPPQGPRVLIDPSDNTHDKSSFPPFNPVGPTTSFQPDEDWVPGRTGPEVDPRDPQSQTALIPLSQIQPLYPRVQAAQGIEGWVSLRFLVQPDGQVSEVRVVDASPRGAFETVARNAVSKWRYRAHDGSPIAQTVTLEFHLDN